MAVLHLVRYINLIIVGLTQYLLYYRIIVPALTSQGLIPRLDGIFFGIFVGITVLVTAGGYIINDIMDYEVDLINRPAKVIVNQRLSEQAAYWLYAATSLTGFILALYLGLQLDVVYLVNLYPLAVILLWLYAGWLKGVPLAGNTLIAFFCAGVAGILWLAEYPQLVQLTILAPALSARVFLLLKWYILFAFLSTLYRELIKDLEDEPGDRIQGIQSAAVKWGIGPAKLITLGIGSLLLLFLFAYGFSFKHFFGQPLILFLMIGLVLPLLVSFHRVVTAGQPAHYRQASRLVKLVMFSGILLLFFATL